CARQLPGAGAELDDEPRIRRHEPAGRLLRPLRSRSLVRVGVSAEGQPPRNGFHPLNLALFARAAAGDNTRMDEPAPTVVVVGAPAGGVEALPPLAAGLPANLEAAVCVVLHLSPHADSRLHEIVSRAGPLPAARARDGETLLPGHIYVAPPDRHLVV